MAIKRIKRLAVSSLRGIRAQRYLAFDGKSVVLLGPNGSGKSSFVEALELAMTGQLRSLTGKAGITFARHATHIRGGDFAVEIEFSDGTTLRRTDGGVTGALPAGYVAGAPEVGAYVLRRRQLLDFIEAQPSTRYDLIRAFIPLHRASAIEEA
jgi:energy-coupling factor transporter ATP-binding protein EcfA2